METTQWIPDLPFETVPEPPPLHDDEEPENRSPNAGNNSALEQGQNVPAGWKPTLDKPLPVVRCTGTVRNGDRKGERCGRWSIMGHDRCLVHGGHLPNVQKAAATKVEAAKLRLIEDADLAVDTLFELLKPGTAANVQLGAAKEILDRAGVKGGYDVNVEITTGSDPSEDILKKLQIMRERAQPKLEDLGEREDEVDEPDANRDQGE
jgi:hypothetical protein